MKATRQDSPVFCCYSQERHARKKISGEGTIFLNDGQVLFAKLEVVRVKLDWEFKP
jgi:hypothetical protein